MKRIALIIAILLFATSAFASGGRPKKIENMNLLGSDDRQHGHHDQRPVPVTEPSTIILLGAGLVGLAAAARKA